MPVRLLPDVEALVREYLAGHASVSALVGSRVSTELPSGTGQALTILLVTGEEIVRDHLDEQIVQLSAWGGTKAEANLLVRTAWAVLLAAPDSDHARGVVTHVRTVAPPRWLPDDSLTPVRPRYVTDMGVFAHPHPL